MSLHPSRAPTLVSLPSCEEMLPLERVRDTVHDEQAVVSATELEIAPSLGQWLPGPLASSSYADAEPSTECSWGIPRSDGLLMLGVSVLDPSVSRELTAALSSSDRYTHETRGDVDIFFRVFDEGAGSGFAYAFRGEVWVIVDGTLVTDTSAAIFAEEVLAAIPLA